MLIMFIAAVDRSVSSSLGDAREVSQQVHMDFFEAWNHSCKKNQQFDFAAKAK